MKLIDQLCGMIICTVLLGASAGLYMQGRTTHEKALTKLDMTNDLMVLTNLFYENCGNGIGTISALGYRIKNGTNMEIIEMKEHRLNAGKIYYSLIIRMDNKNITVLHGKSL